MGTWAEPTDVANAWRPLSDAETPRASTLIDSVERAIKRTWPGELARIGMPTPPVGNGIDPHDVCDVVVWSVISIMANGTDVPANAKAYTLVSGQETLMVTLDGSATGMFLAFLPWMVDVFEDAASTATSTVPVPSGGAQPSQLGLADWLVHEPGDPRFYDRRYW
jgi:hypothetical protein